MICLNVGCNDIQINGFINIDINPLMKPDLVCDATKLREKFQDESIDFVYCGHFLEHLEIDVVKKLIQDFHAILKPYCCAVIVVPDFTKVDIDNVEESERIIMGAGEHRSLMNESRLISLFEKDFTVFPVAVNKLPWCRFPQVIWQSSILALKHSKINFKNG